MAGPTKNPRKPIVERFAAAVFKLSLVLNSFNLDDSKSILVFWFSSSLNLLSGYFFVFLIIICFWLLYNLILIIIFLNCCLVLIFVYMTRIGQLCCWWRLFDLFVKNGDIRVLLFLHILKLIINWVKKKKV